MERAEKIARVAALKKLVGGAGAVVVTRFMGITANEASQARRRMRGTGARFQVTKNRLAQIALAGTPYEGLRELFTGPTAIATAADPVAAAKATIELTKASPRVVIVGGGVGTRRLDPAGVRELASLPPVDQLRANIIGLLSTPAGRLAGLFDAPGAQLARVLGAHANKTETA